MGAGRWGRVASPKWDAIVESLQPIGQRPFVLCDRQGPIACAGRAAGKSYGFAAKYHRPSAAHPGQSALFITQSVERSRFILAPGIWKLNDRFNLGIDEYKKENAFIWPNGYKVLLRGCRDRTECNKRRGSPWVMAIWDEADSIHPALLEYDIHECVEPRLVDFNGTWSVGGTPGLVPHGYWHNLSSGANTNYPLFAWDARTNPHIPNPLQFFLTALGRMPGITPREQWPAGVTSLAQIVDDPKLWHLLPARFVREYLGKWVTDLRSLIYRLTRDHNFEQYALAPTRWTIGCDLGANGPDNEDLDHAAIAVCGSHRTLPYVWVPEARRLRDITVTSLAAELARLCERYPGATIHLDSASAGKIIEKTFRKLGAPIRAAEKGPKLRRIQIVQALIADKFLLLQQMGCHDLRNEAVSLVWDETRTKHSEKCADDVWDALLYAACPHVDSVVDAPDAPPAVGTEEWQRKENLREYEDALREAMDQAA